MNFTPLKIGNLIAKLPIIQGGMGVGVSGSKLASAVANEGAIGVISAVQIGYREDDFEKNTLEANLRALRKEIRKAKELSPNGILGVNILVASNHFDDLVLTSVEEKIDLIICGAGIPSNLPKLVKGSNTKIAPIVSSAKAAQVISKMWKKKYDYLPDLIIVEGVHAGGHLGFSLEQISSSNEHSLSEIIKEVIEVTNSLEATYGKHIPVVAAGGIYDGSDIAKYIKLGAEGVQMATRFVATEECDAHINFKNAYISSSKEDMMIINSPVGMPGRAIKNEFTNSLDNNTSISKCYNCLKGCNPAVTPYCISKALINAVKGDTANGLIFAGSNAYKLDKIKSVKELIQDISKEFQEAN